MSRFAKWTIAGGVGLVVLCGAVYLLAHLRAAAVIAEHRKTVAQDLAEIARRVVLRAPLASWPAGRPLEARPTDARPLYDRALSRFSATPEADRKVMPEFRRPKASGVIDEQAVRAFVLGHQAILDDLGDVLYADRMSSDPRLAEDSNAILGVVQRWRRLTRFLEGATRNALAVGAARVAVPLIPLRLCMGQDLARTGTIHDWKEGARVVTAAIEDARILLARQAHDVGELADLARMLDRLAQSRPSLATCLAGQEHVWRQFILEHVREGAQPFRDPDSRAGLRHLFSDKLLAADMLEEVGPLHREFAAIARPPVHEAWHAAQRRAETLLADDHPLEGLLHWQMPRVFRRWAELELRWHLLRVGVALAQHRAEHGSWPVHLDELVSAYLTRIDVCPLSNAPLGYAKGKVWSIGGDGDDDGGRPLKHRRQIESDGDVAFDLSDE